MDTDELKRCSKCRELKPFDSFHRNKVMADGYANQCIECFRETHKAYRDSEKGQARQARYGASEKGKQVHLGACRAWRQTEKGKAYYKSYYERCKYKNRARGRVFDAVRSGRMPPAKELLCTHCGQPALEYHHHNGYDDKHSFDVIPLCKACHTMVDS